VAKHKKKSSDPASSEAPIAVSQAKSGKSPTEEAAAWLWPQLKDTRGGRLLALALVALAVVGWLLHQLEVFGKIRAVFKTSSTYATSDEITCLNEWVLKLAGENGQAAAEQTRAKFLDDYKSFGHVNYLGQPIWQNDVHVVRDPTHANEWLVVIDMYRGASTRECMESGKAEMVAVLDAKPTDQHREWDNRIGRILRPAEPLCYDFTEFERTNGKILNTGSDVQYQRSFGSCAKKLRNPPGFSCTAGH
jgi:hypothetical protein